MKKIAILIFYFFGLSIVIEGQKVSPLSVGDKVPASVWKKIPRQRTTKLTILDFWQTGCSSCIEAFPKMEKIQKRFPGELQIILVNSWENDLQVKARLKAVNDRRVRISSSSPIILPQLPMINGDSTLKSLFFSYTVPHHVWIDKEGYVRAITYGYNATLTNIESILKGDKFDMEVKNDLLAEKVMKKVQDSGLLQSSDPSLIVNYYSVFTNFYNGMYSISGLTTDSLKGIFRVQQYNTDVVGFFRNAFHSDKKQDRLLLEVMDSERFNFPDSGHLIDNWSRKYVFSYELKGAWRDRKEWQLFMQQDVNRFFGNLFNIEGIMKKRIYNAWVLVKTTDGLLKTLGGESTFSHTIIDGGKKHMGISIGNYPFSEVVNTLSIFENMASGHPFIDETGIDRNMLVDFKLTGDISDINNVRPQLKQFGLDIIEEEREVEVLVIRDKK